MKALCGMCESKRGQGASWAARSPGLRQLCARQEELCPSRHVSSRSSQHIGHSHANPSQPHDFPAPCFSFHSALRCLVLGMPGYLQMGGLGTWPHTQPVLFSFIWALLSALLCYGFSKPDREIKALSSLHQEK